jgi:hypothetical protein
LATSVTRLRALLGGRQNGVAESVRRLVQHGWAAPGSKTNPYKATPLGLAALEEHTR